jgi:hypothetical protein
MQLALHCPLQAAVVVGSMSQVEVVEVGQVASSTTQPSPPHLAPPTLCLWALVVLVLCLRQPTAPLVPTPRLAAWWRSVVVVDSPQVSSIGIWTVFALRFSGVRCWQSIVCMRP